MPTVRRRRLPRRRSRSRSPARARPRAGRSRPPRSPTARKDAAHAPAPTTSNARNRRSGDVRGAGEERRDRPCDADEAPEDDRLAAVAVEDPLDALDHGRRDVEARAVARQELAPEPAAEQVAGRVAGGGCEPDEPEERDDRDVAVARDRAAEHDRQLARHEQADEGRGLQVGEHGDERIRPVRRAPVRAA